ncbi:hypothetical protein NHX12_012535 [Muraenolepis orangiensis]|uniref:Monocarboxylate transporter 12 n=1 Tax=Muraenolepis orangiensis TaxID=630683 RepID=A0A9Q0I4Z4_9TELE|nr:hypothetical protein NHX12_012535 [Muraenolepis orangiensis]
MADPAAMHPGKRRWAESPPDGGWGWVIVACCFMVTVCTRAVTRCISIFFVEFQAHFGGDYSGTAWIHSLVDCTTMLCAPLGSAVASRWSSRVSVVSGGLLSSFGLLLSSFCSNLEGLYLTLGVLTGVGFALCYTPTIATVGCYFRWRRVLAYGVAMSGSGIGTFLLAPAVQLRPIPVDRDRQVSECNPSQPASPPPPGAHAATDHAPSCCGPMRERRPGSCCFPSSRDYRFLLLPDFLCLAVSFLFLASGCSLPFVYLVPYALSCGLSPHHAALLMAIMGGAGIVGNITFGWLTDRRLVGGHDRKLRRHLLPQWLRPPDELIWLSLRLPGYDTASATLTLTTLSLRLRGGGGTSVSGGDHGADRGNPSQPASPPPPGAHAATDHAPSCCGPMRERRPGSCCFPSSRDYRFLLLPDFLCLAVSFLFLASGCSLPFVYLVPYALSCGLSPHHAALLMAIMGGAGIVGNITFGWLTDRRLVGGHDRKLRRHLLPQWLRPPDELIWLSLRLPGYDTASATLTLTTLSLRLRGGGGTSVSGGDHGADRGNPSQPASPPPPGAHAATDHAPSCCGPMRERRPGSCCFPSSRDYRFLLLPDFLCLAVSFLFLASECSLPFVYLVPYALSCGLSPHHAALLMAIMGGAGIAGWWTRQEVTPPPSSSVAPPS